MNVRQTKCPGAQHLISLHTEFYRAAFFANIGRLIFILFEITNADFAGNVIYETKAEVAEDLIPFSLSRELLEEMYF